MKTFYYLYYVINDKDMNTETYLKNNPIVEKFIKKVNAEIEDYYATNLSNLTPNQWRCVLVLSSSN